MINAFVLAERLRVDFCFRAASTAAPTTSLPRTIWTAAALQHCMKQRHAAINQRSTQAATWHNTMPAIVGHCRISMCRLLCRVAAFYRVLDATRFPRDVRPISPLIYAATAWISDEASSTHEHGSDGWAFAIALCHIPQVDGENNKMKKMKKIK
jgi:hypothetical protein